MRGLDEVKCGECGVGWTCPTILEPCDCKRRGCRGEIYSCTIPGSGTLELYRQHPEPKCAGLIEAFENGQLRGI